MGALYASAHCFDRIAQDRGRVSALRRLPRASTRPPPARSALTEAHLCRLRPAHPKKTPVSRRATAVAVATATSPASGEHLAGGGVAHRRDDRNVACIEATRDRLRVDLAHGAGVLKIDPVVPPIGCAVMKFPETVLITAPAMGEFGSPSESSASISTRRSPTASLTHSSATDR